MNPRAYTRTAIGLHWFIALLILATLPLGLYMTGLDLSPMKLKLYSYHKWIGVTVFGLAILRLLWRATHRPPPPPVGMPAWQHRAATVVHGLLYLLLFLIPLSGWLMSSAKGFQTVYFGVLPLPNLLAKDEALGDFLATVHQGFNLGLATLLAAHVGAALKHHFIDRDEVLTRMWPGLHQRKGG